MLALTVYHSFRHFTWYQNMHMRGFFQRKFSEGAKPTFQEIREVKLKYIPFMQYIHLVHVPLSACLSQRT